MVKKQSEPSAVNDESNPAASDIGTAPGELIEERNALTETEQSSQSLSDAIHEGARDAREAAANFLPSLASVIQRGIYGSFYCLSYGVVFGGLTIGRLVPRDSIAGKGIRAGADAACKDFKEWEEQSAAAATEADLDAQQGGVAAS